MTSDPEAGRIGTGAVAPKFQLDRRTAIPALIGRHQDFVIIAGLGGTAWDLTALTDNAPNLYPLAGAMGGAAMVGLGLALAQPGRRVLVITGDGELLMNVGALCTIAVTKPPNLAIVCVDNGHYGETGYQKCHTSLGTDLEQIAIGAGIKRTLTVEQETEIAAGASLIREGNATTFVLLRVKPTEPADFRHIVDAAEGRYRFRVALAKDSAASTPA
jgi:thiamine pyrophosphate-dependent acetolactate synthase large subunit-like protein